MRAVSQSLWKGSRNSTYSHPFWNVLTLPCFESSSRVSSGLLTPMVVLCWRVLYLNAAFSHLLVWPKAFHRWFLRMKIWFCWTACYLLVAVEIGLLVETMEITWPLHRLFSPWVPVSDCGTCWEVLETVQLTCTYNFSRVQTKFGKLPCKKSSSYPLELVNCKSTLSIGAIFIFSFTLDMQSIQVLITEFWKILKISYYHTLV